MSLAKLLCRFRLANPSDHSLLGLAAGVFITGAAYFISAKLGLALAFVHPSATAVWPPTGIALAALILFGYQLWPGIFAGAFFANITTAGSVWTSLGIATGNTLEAALGAYLVNRFAGGRNAFDRPHDVLKFATLAGLASTAVSATLGVTSLYLGGLVTLSEYAHVWFTWWLGDMGGAVIVAPLLILWLADPRFIENGPKLRECVITFALLAVVGYGGFASFPAESVRTASIAFLSIPILLWTAVRLGRREASAAVFLIFAVAVWGTLHGNGPFVRADPNESLLLLQEVGGMVAVMILMLSAAICSRNRTEHTLRDSESRKTAVVESALDCVITMDHEGRIVDFNPAAERTFGYKHEDVIGKTVAETIIPGRLRTTHRMGLNRYLATGEHKLLNQRIEMPAMRCDGTEFSSELAITVVSLQGKRPFFTAHLRDISDRKRWEQELWESRGKLSTVIAAADVGTWDWNIQAGTVEVNDRFCTMLGYEPGAFGIDVRRFFDSVHPDDLEKVNQCVEAHFAGESELYQCDFRLRMADGGYRWIHDSGRLIERDAGGRPLRMVGIHTDITEQKRGEEELKRFNEKLEKRVAERTGELTKMNADLARSLKERGKLEQQLRQAQKMEAIGTLAGGVAHDFNNLLNIIEGYASLLNQRAGKNQDVAESVTVIHDTVKRGAAVVQQLLTFARNVEPRMELTDPNTLIRQLASLLKETLPRTIELKLELAPELPPLMADSNQVVQALLNLCLNARDAMPDGGTLIIKTRIADDISLEEYSERRAEPYVCVEVEDSGLGMDETIRSRIFDPFFTTKGIGRGTGLGLALVYGIVKAHAGFVTFDSQPGKGTTFRIFLPLAETSPQEVQLKTAPAGLLDATGRTILLVEDENHTLRLLQTVLRSSGFEILTAADGNTAVETFQRHRDHIDVVLLDLGIPKLHGKEVLRKIKNEKPDVKVIVATGYLEPEVELELARFGVRTVIKPYSVEEIRGALSLALQDSQNREHKRGRASLTSA